MTPALASSSTCSPAPWLPAFYIALHWILQLGSSSQGLQIGSRIATPGPTRLPDLPTLARYIRFYIKGSHKDILKNETPVRIPNFICFQEIHSFIHCRHLYSASSSGATQKRSHPQRGRIMVF